MNPITTSIACLGLALACSAQSGRNWTQIKPAVSPPGRFVHAMAYDSVRKRTVLFGGRDRFMLFADTWEWDGKNWTQIKPSTSPLGRSRYAMAYDSARGRTVIFGGRSPSSTTLSDTWEWDGKNWTQRKPATSPTPCSEHAMAYDSGRRRTVMFGGYGTGYLNETWEWDGYNWAQIKPATSPSARTNHAMVYDSVRQRTVMFGGRAGGYMNDTWEWDGRNWAQIKPSTLPPPRLAHAMAYDSARGRTVMFGGLSSRGHFADTWAWDGKNWTQSKPTASPSPRYEHAMAYDSGRGHTVMFGGNNGYMNDTWEYVTASLANFTPFGKGCMGSAGIPQLTATTQPIYGKTFTTTLSRLQTAPAASPFMIVGMSNQQWGAIKLPLDLGLIGLPGCKLLVSTDVSLLLKNSAGTARFNLVIPSKNSWLIGKSFYLQGAVLDLKANPLGVALSNAGKATIGL